MAATSGILQRSVRSRSHWHGWWHHVTLAEESFCLDIAAKNHKHAVNNPYAQFREGWTEEQVLNSPQVSDMITKLMCTPTSVRRLILSFLASIDLATSLMPRMAQLVVSLLPRTLYTLTSLRTKLSKSSRKQWRQMNHPYSTQEAQWSWSRRG